MQLLRACAGGRCDDQCCLWRTSAKSAQNQSASIFGNCEDRVFSANLAERRLVTSKNGEFRKLHGFESVIEVSDLRVV